MMKIANVLLKVTHLKSPKSLMHQGFNSLFVCQVLLLLLNIIIYKKIKYINILYSAIKICGNKSNI